MSSVMEAASKLLICLVTLGGAATLACSRAPDPEHVTRAELRAEAEVVLERIATELRSAWRETLFPDPDSPTYTEAVTYNLLPGESGVPEPARSMSIEEGSVVLTTGARGEQREVLTHRVQPLLLGEAWNGVDDNGNGLIDEAGLSFTLAGNEVHVRLSLQARGPEGRQIAVMREELVTLPAEPVAAIR